MSRVKVDPQSHDVITGITLNRSTWNFPLVNVEHIRCNKSATEQRYIMSTKKQIVLNQTVNAGKSSFGLGTVVFLIFLTLKLAELGAVATWSWWWVTLPLWITPAIFCSIFAGVGLIWLLLMMIAGVGSLLMSGTPNAKIRNFRG